MLAAGIIPSDDRAFLYGDGVFETLLCVRGKLLWPELHLDRLVHGAKRLGIEADRAQLLRGLNEIAREDSTSSVIRLTLSRGSGERGYTPPIGTSPRIVIARSVLSRHPLKPLPPAHIGMSSVIMGDQPLLAGIKHCNRLEQVLAAREAAEQKLDDVLLTNARGTIQCSSCCNVFALIDGCLRTPDSERSGVLGTRQRVIVETLAPALSLDVAIGELSPTELLRADGIVLSNAILGIRRVKRLNQQVLSLSKPNALDALQNLYYAEAQRCLGE